MSLITGRASPAGTRQFAERLALAAARAAPTGSHTGGEAAGIAAGHFLTRVSGLRGLTISSLGVGTYLGDCDQPTDDAVVNATAAAVAAGVNVLDTAINYRHQRAERSLGRLLERLLAPGRLDRSELLIATKAGYVPGDGLPPPDRAAYIRETYIRTGLIGPGELVGSGQCFAPRFLVDQIERSRRNLRVETIDLVYLHNPEYMLAALGRTEWLRRIEAAFRALEGQVAAGRIAAYGTATWDGYRVGAVRPDHLEMAELVALAEQVAGRGHHFAAVQLPVSVAAPEAVRSPTQTVRGRLMTALDAAEALGLTAFGSAPLLQGRALSGVPSAWADHRAFAGLTTPAQRALQWARGQASLCSVLVGMKSPAHVAENLAVLKTARPQPTDLTDL